MGTPIFASEKIITETKKMDSPMDRVVRSATSISDVRQKIWLQISPGRKKPYRNIPAFRIGWGRIRRTFMAVIVNQSGVCERRNDNRSDGIVIVL